MSRPSRAQRPRLVQLALLGLAAAALLGTAQARAQVCINEAAPAPLEICVDADGRYNVWLDQNGSRTSQFYVSSGYSTDWVVGIGADGQRRNFSGGYVLEGASTAPELISHGLSGTGTQADPYVVETVLGLPDTGVELTQQFFYVNGERTLRKRWVLRNHATAAVWDLNLFHGGDATLGGIDDARSWFDAAIQMVYLTNNAAAQYGYMGTAAHPASPADHYYGGFYNADHLIAQGDLPDTADPTFLDAGYYLQWKRGELQPGQSWVVEAYETWSPPGALQVIAPAAVHINPGETRTLRFKVHNVSATAPATANVQAVDALNWTVTALPTNLSLPAGSSAEVDVTVTAPANAVSGQINTVSLHAQYGSQTYTGSVPLQVLNLDYEVPAAVAFGPVALGETRTEVLTFRNQGDVVTLGWIDPSDSLGPQFSVSQDNCSGQTLASGASCTLTVHFEPSSPQTYSGTLYWPILAPTLVNATTTFTAADGGVRVNTAANAGGSITPDSLVAPYLQQATFTVTPQPGHYIHSVTGCGGTLNGNSYTTATLNQSCTVTAEFRVIQYRVNAGIIGNGTLSPLQRDVTSGQTATFTVTPAVGHHLSNITGCGGTLAGNRYTTAAVTASCQIQATFLPNRYSVSITHQGGGTLSPSYAQVIHGGGASFTLTPAAGYRLAGATGCGGRLEGQQYHVADITADCAIEVSFAAAEPVFTSDLTATLDIDATGLLTTLPMELFPQAVDHQGQPVRVTLVSERTRFAPGRHELQWRALDARGVTATATQILRVWPMVSMGPDVWAGQQRGDTGAFRVVLNGRAPQYPFEVAYEVDGEHAEHDLRSGHVTFADGETEKEVYFAVTQEPAADAPARTITVSLDQGRNIGARDSLQINMSSINMPPLVALQARRDTQAGGSFDRHGGPITLSAEVHDPNSRDSHSYLWTAPANAAVTEQGHELILQADSLLPGVHRFRVQVSDDGSPAAATTAVLDLVISDGPATLPEGADGWLDSGLPNHPAYAPAVRNALPGRGGQLQHHLLETEPGLKLSLGAMAVQANNAQSSLTLDGADIPPDSIANVGGYFDFIVAGLGGPGQSIALVVPQQTVVPARAVYRKYDARAGQWFSFVENSLNQLASAPGAPGVCPPPHSSDYRPGLTEGHWCVRVTIEDGGPNDTDGERNGVIADPGGVGRTAAAPPPTPTPPPAEGRRGGRGSMGWVVLGMLGLLAGTRRLNRLRCTQHTSSRHC